MRNIYDPLYRASGWFSPLLKREGWFDRNATTDAVTVTLDLASTETADIAAFAVKTIAVVNLAATEGRDTAAFSATVIPEGIVTLALNATEGADSAHFVVKRRLRRTGGSTGFIPHDHPPQPKPNTVHARMSNELPDAIRFNVAVVDVTEAILYVQHDGKLIRAETISPPSTTRGVIKIVHCDADGQPTADMGLPMSLQEQIAYNNRMLLNLALLEL